MVNAHNDTPLNANRNRAQEAAWLATIFDPQRWPESDREEIQAFMPRAFELWAQGGEDWRELRVTLVREYGEPCPPEPLTAEQENWLRAQLGEPPVLDLGQGYTEATYAAMLKRLATQGLLLQHSIHTLSAHYNKPTPACLAKIRLQEAELTARGSEYAPYAQEPAQAATQKAPRTSRKATRRAA